jgi:hypothetical protein
MNQLTFSANRVRIWLLLILVGLVILHLIGQYLWHIQGLTHLSIYIDRFNLNEEISFPTWFATMLLLVSAALMWLTGTTSKNSVGRYWKVLTVIFLLMSIDEGSSFHEIFSDLFRAILNIQSGWLYYAWVIPGAVVVLAVLLYFFRFWWGLPIITRRLTGWAAAIYVGGAIGVELLGSYYASTLGGYDFNYFALVALEEGMEKLGLIILIYALMRYLAEQKTNQQITFRP